SPQSSAATFWTSQHSRLASMRCWNSRRTSHSSASAKAARRVPPSRSWHSVPPGARMRWWRASRTRSRHASRSNRFPRCWRSKANTAFRPRCGRRRVKLSQLEGKRVAIWGYGREGRAALAALRWKLPRTPLALLCSESEAEQAAAVGDPGLYIFTEEVTPELLARFHVVIKSPGISPYHGAAAQAIAAGTTFVSGTSLWFAENPDARKICVTGTKGKSTTTALVAHLLRASGARTALAGNIGMPLLELIDEEPADAWAIELSSYQTRDAVEPDVAVVLNLFPEHLDWHGSE